jgi:hypothetical protein
VYKLPETLEEITVWKLENAQRVESYLYHLQLTNFPWCAGLTARELVLEWLARIHAMGIVTSVQTYRANTAHQYYTVSVAGIEICILSQKERNEIIGETRV